MTPILDTLFRVCVCLMLSSILTWLVLPVIIELIKSSKNLRKTRKERQRKQQNEIDKITEASIEFAQLDKPDVFQPHLKLRDYVTLMKLTRNHPRLFDKISDMAFFELHDLETEHRKTMVSPMEFRPMMIHGLAFGTSMLNDVLRPIFQEIFLQTQGTDNYQQSFNLDEYTEIKKHYEYSIRSIQQNADHPILVELFTNVPYDPALNENRTFLQQLIHEGEIVIAELSEKIEIISALEGGDQ